MSTNLQDLLKKKITEKKISKTSIKPILKTPEQERFCCYPGSPISLHIGKRKLVPNIFGFYEPISKEECEALISYRKRGFIALESDLVPAISD